jgi:hypothetical protein
MGKKWGEEMGLKLHCIADSWLLEAQASSKVWFGIRATSIPPAAGTPFGPTTQKTEFCELRTGSPTSAFIQTGHNTYREVE